VCPWSVQYLWWIIKPLIQINVPNGTQDRSPYCDCEQDQHNKVEKDNVQINQIKLISCASPRCVKGFDSLLDDEVMIGTGVAISLHQNAMYRDTSEILLGSIKNSQMLMKSEEGALILQVAEVTYDRHQDLLARDLSSENSSAPCWIRCLKSSIE
jgi:hypothetical protein